MRVLSLSTTQQAPRRAAAQSRPAHSAPLPRPASTLPRPPPCAREPFAFRLAARWRVGGTRRGGGRKSCALPASFVTSQRSDVSLPFGAACLLVPRVRAPRDHALWLVKVGWRLPQGGRLWLGLPLGSLMRKHLGGIRHLCGRGALGASCFPAGGLRRIPGTPAGPAGCAGLA